LRDDCHNRSIIAAFRKAPEQYHTHVNEGIGFEKLKIRRELFKENLRIASSDTSVKTMILSAEELSNFHKEEIQQLVDYLKHLEFETSGIGYVRKYKQLQESRFQQALRAPHPNGRCLPPEDKRFAAFPYINKISKFLDVLGDRAVTLRPFKPTALIDGCVVCDFCKATGISQGPSHEEQANRSLSLDAVRLLYSYRKFAKESESLSDPMWKDHLLCEKLAQLCGKRAAFHSSIFLRSEPRWRADVEWISERLGEDMCGDLHTDDEEPCIRNETDLFCFSNDSLEWLALQAGLAPSKLNHANPEAVADAVEILRNKTLSNTGAQYGFITRAKGFLNRFFNPHGGKLANEAGVAS